MLWDFDVPEAKITGQLGGAMDMTGHRDAGGDLRTAAKSLNRLARKFQRVQTVRMGFGSPPSPVFNAVIATAEAVNDLRYNLSKAWELLNKKGCPESHCPYYGNRSCSRCNPRVLEGTKG